MIAPATRGVPWLDWAIAPAVHTDPEALARARIVVGAGLGLATSALTSVLALPTLGVSPLMGFVFSGTGLCYVLAVYTVRRWGTTRLAAWMIGATLTALMLFMAAQRDAEMMITSAWNAAVPLFFTYVLGARAGMFATAGIASALVGVWYLHQFGITHNLMRGTHSTTSTMLGHVGGLVLIAGFGALYRSSRDRVEEQRQQTLSALDAEQRKLVSVLESTVDVIFSIDADYRLVHFNASAERLFLGRGSRPRAGDFFLDGLPPDEAAVWRERLERVATQGAIRLEACNDSSDKTWEIAITPIGESPSDGLTIYAHDITRRKADEQQLLALHRDMVALSRRAGMADVATNVLHNVGNVLTSAAVSTSNLAGIIKRKEGNDLARLVALLPREPSELTQFLLEDARGKLVVPYMEELARESANDAGRAREELRALNKGLEHINAVIRDQQSAAAASPIVEACDPVDLMATATLLSMDGPVERVSIDALADDDLPPLRSDRHKVIQILANILANARHAVANRDRGTIETRVAVHSDAVVFEVRDNGVGIDDDGLSKIFQHGYTTKPTGHGFGLHSAANDAASLGGRLFARSEGLGRGATFVLELPIQPPARFRQRAAAATRQRAAV